MAIINLPTSDFVTTTLNGALAAAATTATIGTGLGIPATNGILQIDYDSTAAVGADNGPETIYYTAYTTATGALTGITRGYAGTTDVLHANGASVQAGPSVKYWTPWEDSAAGWFNPNETWTYATASTFTIAGVDKTATYTTGTSLRFKQGGAYKYATVASSTFSTDTTVTIIVNTDYTIANATITDNYYSYVENPQGFPGLFNRSVTPTGTTVGNGTWTEVYSVHRNTVFVVGVFTFNSTSSVGATTFDPPVSMHASMFATNIGIIRFMDSGTESYVGFLEAASADVVTVRVLDTATSNGTLNAISSTNPMTWATGDTLAYNYQYIMA